MALAPSHYVVSLSSSQGQALLTQPLCASIQATHEHLSAYCMPACGSGRCHLHAAPSIRSFPEVASSCSALCGPAACQGFGLGRRESGPRPSVTAWGVTLGDYSVGVESLPPLSLPPPDTSHFRPWHRGSLNSDLGGHSSRGCRKNLDQIPEELGLSAETQVHSCLGPGV